MSAASWRMLSWFWLGLAVLWVVLEASAGARYGTLIAAIVARGVSDILAALAQTEGNSTQPQEQGER